MNSSTLKHQAKLQEWAMTVQECRASGQPVRHWCKENGITPATYYRWERELLSIPGNTHGEKPAVAFAELPALEGLYRNVLEGSETPVLYAVRFDAYEYSLWQFFIDQFHPSNDR